MLLPLFVSAVGVASGGGGFHPTHRRGRGSSPQWKEHYSKVSEKWGAIATGATISPFLGAKLGRVIRSAKRIIKLFGICVINQYKASG